MCMEKMLKCAMGVQWVCAMGTEKIAQNKKDLFCGVVRNTFQKQVRGQEDAFLVQLLKLE